MRRKITIKEIEQIYPLAKSLHDKKLKAADKLRKEADMNVNSAKYYIEAFLAMMEGRTYQKTINYEAHEYFLEKIHEDFGLEALKKALLSVKKHIVFYEETENHPLPGIEKVYQKFSKRLL